METWRTPTNNQIRSYILNHNIHFPLPWLVFFWNDERKLEFQVRCKSNQKLKFINKGSTYTSATFKGFLSNIFNWLEKLTSGTDKHSWMKVDDKYLGHANALIQSGLAPKISQFWKNFVINQILQNRWIMWSSKVDVPWRVMYTYVLYFLISGG